MPKIKFLREKKEIEVPEGANLRKEALKAGIEIYKGLHRYAHCPGLGMCTTCKVYIKKGIENVNKPTILEKINTANALLHPITYLHRIGHENELRLSCQTYVYGDIEVETQPEFNWHGEKFWE